ncbi:hypothetical protein F4819DRAFT_276391 [Hypoxylon fuscum]|nr:hypothetical protein F4819DRAFT_276391 [Hypoxylon fuscum]
MERLPPELSLQVFKYLLKVDLKSLRLVSRNINSITTKLLFNRAYASLHLKDLEILSAISRHPTIRLAVEEIVYSGVFFHHGQHSDQESGPGREYYYARIEEDKITLRDREDVTITCRALASMPNIRTVTLTNYWPHDYATRKSPGNARINIDRGFSVMCRAVSISDLPVQEFSVDYASHHRNGVTAGLSAASFLLDPYELKYCCAAFRRLRRISLSLSKPKKDEEWDILMEGNVAKVLAAATELEELTLNFTIRSNNVPLEKYTGTHTWPCLRSLKLCEKELPQTELVGLLHRHRQTLKTLCLEEVNLEDGTWQSLVEETRQWLRLESVSFHWLGERVDPWNIKTPFCDELEKYMLHGESGPIYRPNYFPQTPTR